MEYREIVEEKEESTAKKKSKWKNNNAPVSTIFSTKIKQNAVLENVAWSCAREVPVMDEEQGQIQQTKKEKNNSIQFYIYIYI